MSTIPCRKSFLSCRASASAFISALRTKKQFQKIVSTLADRYGVRMSEDELLLKANQWELSHGGLSGRTAQQFIDYLLGQ